MEKTFDCLKMKAEIQAKIYAEIKDMSPDERIAYFNDSAQNDPLWQRLVARDRAREAAAARERGAGAGCALAAH